MTKDGYYIRNGKEIKKATASTPIMDKGKLFDISRIRFIKFIILIHYILETLNSYL
mgnify:CR=1 FL=1